MNLIAINLEIVNFNNILKIKFEEILIKNKNKIYTNKKKKYIHLL